MGDARCVESEHACTPTVASAIRGELRALLTSWQLVEELVQDALLVVEEFVANVVDHANGSFRLAVELIGSRLLLSVRDGSDSAPRLQPIDPYAARGRGLQLVEAVSVRWGCRSHDTGKTVWAELTA